MACCITQHRRFMLYGTHPSFYFAKTSFMLKTLAAIVLTQNYYSINTLREDVNDEFSSSAYFH